MRNQQGGNGSKPNIVCGNLAKPPVALQPLLERKQWVIWRLILENGRWTKPPFRADDPLRHASSADPTTWTDYASAVAAVHAGLGDGVTYVLTPDDPFAALDIDKVRNPTTGAIEEWAQRLLNQASRTYAEISPSGTGLRIWGSAKGEPLHRHFAIGLELFRRTRKPLTVTGLQLGNSLELGNIDALVDRAEIWGQQQQHKAAAKAKPGQSFAAGLTGQYSLEEIERIVQEGAPDGANRSDTFHGIVGHYFGCGWTAEQITELLEEHPQGVADRYIAEGRLAKEVQRSIDAFTRSREEEPQQQAWTNGWQAQASPKQEQAELEAQEQLEQPQPDALEQEQLEQPELEQDEEDNSDLPPMYSHGDPDPRPLRSWAIKGIMPAQGHGLLSGQWGAYKSFIALDLSAALMTGQPFLGHLIKRQCGVLFLAAEGQYEMRPRLTALAQEKCGGLLRAPFRWYEDVPVLLQPDGLSLLVRMGKRAACSLEQEFGLPLGLVLIDTIAASAGYTAMGSESDNAITQRLMNVLKIAAQQLDCFVLGVDHFGKDVTTGTRGGSAKEGSGDLVLACLGDRALQGTVVNTRLAVRKCRGGRNGQEFPFSVREIEIGKDEDGDPETTLVIDWDAKPQATAQPPNDPWAESKRNETRAAMLLLKRIMMAKLAEHGEWLPLEPRVHGINQEIVRKEFFATTPVSGDERQKQQARSKRFRNAVERAAEKQLIAVREIGTITYFWFLHQTENNPDEF